LSLSVETPYRASLPALDPPPTAVSGNTPSSCGRNGKPQGRTGGLAKLPMAARLFTEVIDAHRGHRNRPSGRSFISRASEPLSQRKYGSFIQSGVFRNRFRRKSISEH
jgi:hypothetical protein